MPFIDSSASLRSKAHASDVKTPVLMGLLVLIGISIFLFGNNVVGAVSGAEFDLVTSAVSTRSIAGESVSSSAELESSDAEALAQDVYVFVSGAVANPGVYVLKAGERVGDAITLAGGFVEGAANDYNNLARVVEDGEQIHVPTVDQLEAGSASSTGVGASSVVAPGISQEVNGLVNINMASQTELEALPGIGPSTAQKIIAEREANGPFATTDELKRVSGIGDKKYSALEGLICV